MNKPDSLESKTPEELRALLKVAQAEISKKNQELDQLKETLNGLLEQLNLLKHGKFGRKSEKFPDEPDTATAFDEAQPPDNTDEIEEADEDIHVRGHKRKKSKGTGRKPLPDILPRLEKIYDLEPNEKVCACGTSVHPMGESVCEQLDIIPAVMYVIRHIRKKYACKQCQEGVKEAKFPKQPIPKSLAAPGLLSHIITSKFEDHLPLYRQERILNRIGIDIARATLSSWVIKCSELLKPLCDIGQEQINAYDVAYADETLINVLKEPGRAVEKKSYMWIFGGGPPEQFFILYHYASSRSHEIPAARLKDFSGFLHCDGYRAYDTLSENRQIAQVGCWYHARRKFVEAQKVSKKAGMAQKFIKEIGKLAKVEKQAAGLSVEERHHLRQEESVPLLEKMHSDLIAKQSTVPASTLLGKAIQYTLNQWPKLMNYTKDGRLENSNNRMERCAKPFATGRKNWLFANSVAGADAAAVLFSLIETCKYHQISSYQWLRYVLEKIPHCKDKTSLKALLPFCNVPSLSTSDKVVNSSYTFF